MWQTRVLISNDDVHSVPLRAQVAIAFAVLSDAAPSPYAAGVVANALGPDTLEHMHSYFLTIPGRFKQAKPYAWAVMKRAAELGWVVVAETVRHVGQNGGTRDKPLYALTAPANRATTPARAASSAGGTEAASP